MNDETMRVGPGTRVTLHFSVSLADGQLLDTTKNGKPAEFTFGDGNLINGFESGLLGLKAGDHRSLFLTAEKAFGARSEENIQHFSRSQFSNMDLEPGLMVSFSDKRSSELPGVVTEFNDDTVVVDFNHPLAGRDLNYEVEIINVVDASSAKVRLA
ncbi:Peptidylprolyl isomerase, FKBP-type [gamma proteobacterium HdN1]|nr:Peptidylprolyl isomerase, FKBP-type [gamma proteobacterium HdN1]